MRHEEFESTIKHPLSLFAAMTATLRFHSNLPFFHNFWSRDACNNNSTLKKRDGWKRREESRVRWCACESFFGILLCADAYTRNSTSCVSFFILQLVCVVPDFLSSGENYVSGPLVYSLLLQAGSFYYYVRNGSHASPLYSFPLDALQIYFLYLLPSLFSRYFSGSIWKGGRKVEWMERGIIIVVICLTTSEAF